jgi:hypothetical protein
MVIRFSSGVSAGQDSQSDPPGTSSAPSGKGVSRVQIGAHPVVIVCGPVAQPSVLPVPGSDELTVESADPVEQAPRAGASRWRLVRLLAGLSALLGSVPLLLSQVGQIVEVWQTLPWA